MKINTNSVDNYVDNLKFKRSSNYMKYLDLAKSNIPLVYLNAIVNDSAVCFMVLNSKYFVLKNLDINYIKYFLKHSEELVDGTEEKSEKKQSSQQKSSGKKEQSEQTPSEEQSNPSGDGNGDNGNGNDEKDEDDKDRNDPDYSELEEEEQEDEESEEQGEYSEDDSEEKQAEDIEKAKKVYHGPEKEGELEGEISLEPEEVIEVSGDDENEQETPVKPKRRRSRRDLSPAFKKRLPQEQEILHRFYEKLQDAKKAGGKHPPGYVINSFDPEERDVIHSFLHEAGKMGAEAKYGKKYPDEEEESRETKGELKERKTSERERVSFLDRYSEDDQNVILKFFYDVTQKRPRDHLESEEEEEEARKESGQRERKKVKAETTPSKKATLERKVSPSKKSYVTTPKRQTVEKQKELKKEPVNIKVQVTEVKKTSKSKENVSPKAKKSISGKSQTASKKPLTESTNVNK